jgi:hypothetical protein
MITYRNKNSWQRPLVIALIGSVAVGGGVWWWMGHSGSDATTQVASSASGASASSGMGTTSGSGMGMAVESAPSAPLNAPNGSPSDFQPAVWAALNKAMTNKPQLKPEIERVMSYMRFQRSFEYWQSLEDTRDVQQRHQLAQSMLNEMPSRLSKGEFTMSEALMMVTALLSDLEPDEKRREQQVEDWGKKLNQAAPQPTEDAQVLELQKRAEDKRIVPGILAEWSSNPDQNRLESALAAAH